MPHTRLPGFARAEEREDSDREEEIDTEKVQSERDRAITREKTRGHTSTQGPDSPTEEGEA